MLSYTLKRLLQAIPTLLIVITLSFFLMRVAPGGPFDGERRLPPEIEQNLRAAYHLDEPLPMQYLRYLGDLVQGDLGPSFKDRLDRLRPDDVLAGHRAGRAGVFCQRPALHPPFSFPA